MSDDKTFLTLDQAIPLLPEGNEIHTLRNPAAGILIGADWTRARILEVLAAAPFIEVTGPRAQETGHGLFVEDEHGALYIQAAEYKTAIQRPPSAIPDNIKELAADLHEACKRDLTPEQWTRVLAAKGLIQAVVHEYGEDGQVALSLCCADFAAE